jgi:hypothetical protein
MKKNSQFSASTVKDLSFGLVGTALGATLGYYIFFLFVKQGFYAPLIPGASSGILCAMLSGRKSYTLAITSCITALILSVFIEWQLGPFLENKSFFFFIKNLNNLPPATKILIGIGGVLAFWFGLGKESGVWPRKKSIKIDSDKDQNPGVGEENAQDQ